MFKHFCTVDFNIRNATQTRSKYKRLKYIKKLTFKHFCTVNFNTRNDTQTRSKYTRLKYIKNECLNIFVLTILTLALLPKLGVNTHV